jgi:hypothetical protein
MKYAKLFSAIVAVGLIALVGSRAIAEPAKDAKSAGQPEMKLPPGWTEDDMKACITASMPAKIHGELTKRVGTWKGKSTMWMYPGAEPLTSACTSTVTPMLDGRFVKVEYAGEMPGMGPFNGFGIYGFDNVTQQFVSTWIDSCGTGMAHGTGELSTDGKVLTMNRTFNCPLAKKPVAMREIETYTGPNTKTLEIFCPDPKSGKEYKMLSVEFTKR